MNDTVSLDRDDAFWLVHLSTEVINSSEPTDRNRLARIIDEVNAQPIRSGRPVEDPLSFDVFVVWVEGMTRPPIAVRRVQAEAIMIARIYNSASDGLNAIVLGYRFGGFSDGMEITLRQD